MGDSGPLGTLVRSWVHYDSLASSFYKQSMNARKVRDEYDNKIIQYLRQTGMENAVIQTNNGRLSVIEDKKPSQLSLTKIEELLHSFYRTRGGKDETLDIIQFIKANRGYDIKKCIRKSHTVNQPPIPPLPQLQ
jgi:hypothetical protein